MTARFHVGMEMTPERVRPMLSVGPDELPVATFDAPDFELAREIAQHLNSLPAETIDRIEKAALDALSPVDADEPMALVALFRPETN